MKRALAPGNRKVSGGEHDLDRLVRYCHPAKLLAAQTPLSGTLDEPALARLYDVAPARYRSAIARLLDEARVAATQVRVALGDRVADARAIARNGAVAVGDSQTDDLGSWAEILRHVLAADVANAGVSGDTTTAARARLDRVPDSGLAVVMLGTNDARRHGRVGAPMLVSDSETARNLQAIDAALRERCDRVLWITPPPVDEARILADPVLTDADLVWRADDVARKADLVRVASPDAIDLWPFVRPDHLAADGVHLSPAGQRLVAEAVIGALMRITAPTTQPH